MAGAMPVVFVIVAIAFVSYLSGQHGSVLKKGQTAIVVHEEAPRQLVNTPTNNESAVLMEYVDKRLQEHEERLQKVLTMGLVGANASAASHVEKQLHDYNSHAEKRLHEQLHDYASEIEKYILRPFSRLNNELDQKLAEVAAHSGQLAHDLQTTKSVLETYPDTVDAWLAATMLPNAQSVDWRHPGYPSKVGYPDIKDREKCEQVIDDVLQVRTDMQPKEWQEAQVLPDYVCKFFRKLQATKVCRPAGSRSWIWHTIGINDLQRLRAFINDFRNAIRQYAYNGHVYFTHIELMVDRKHAKWVFDEDTWIVNATIVAAQSFKEVHGLWPMVIANSEREQIVLARAGVPSFVDRTLIWRGAGVADWRQLSRTTIMKYIYAYFILEAGFTAVFFDSDGFWLRKLELPSDGSQMYDMIVSEEAHTKSPGGKYYRKDPLTDPKAHGYRPVYQNHDAFPTALMQTTCNGFSDTILYNSGLWVAYPTEWTFRFISTLIDHQLVLWAEWWEQNLFQHLISIYSAWGMRVGAFGPGVSSHGIHQYRSVQDCNAGVQGMYAWVHTKFGNTSWPMCKGVSTWKPHEGFSDVRDANITMHMIAVNQ